jgi:hypothetical protein
MDYDTLFEELESRLSVNSESHSTENDSLGVTECFGNLALDQQPDYIDGLLEVVVDLSSLNCSKLELDELYETLSDDSDVKNFVGEHLYIEELNTLEFEFKSYDSQKEELILSATYTGTVPILDPEDR